MSELSIVRRGFVPADKQEFSEKMLPLLRRAAAEIGWLINRGYQIKNASTFVGNHYLLSERQRLALARSISSTQAIEARLLKLRRGNLVGETVAIDGFNLIITLEVALSGCTLIRGMDGTVRDLAGLRGTYRLIDKTVGAIGHIGSELEQMGIKKAIFYLDSPVSNSGRLKSKLLKTLTSFSFETEVILVNNADVVLEHMEHVITSDAIILDKCKSWINLASDIIGKNEILVCNLIS